MPRTEHASTVWRCPECPETIPVIVVIHRWKFGITVYLTDRAMVDVFAHAWAHVDTDDETPT